MKKNKTLSQLIGEKKKELKRAAVNQFIHQILKKPLIELKLMSQNKISGLYSESLRKAKERLGDSSPVKKVAHP